MANAPEFEYRLKVLGEVSEDPPNLDLSEFDELSRALRVIPQSEGEIGEVLVADVYGYVAVGEATSFHDLFVGLAPGVKVITKGIPNPREKSPLHVLDGPEDVGAYRINMGADERFKRLGAFIYTTDRELVRRIHFVALSEYVKNRSAEETLDWLLTQEEFLPYISTEIR